MNRKLLILDVALAAMAVYAGFQFRGQWLAAKAREAATLNRKPNPLPPPQFTPLATAPPVLSAGYAEIAQKLLFDRSRNSTVVVDVPPPPPPKPMPPLPVYHGMMNIGDGPAAILSINATSPQMEIHPGEAIGPFKLVDVNTQEIALEWDGKVIHKTVDEILDRTTREVVADANTPAPAGPPPPVLPVIRTPLGPGEDAGQGYKTCIANDSTPEQTVVDGYRKVSIKTPFGSACRWDPVGR
ncbi:MAG: hypothetical protein ABSG26_05940 [Bryobacteraceae bacterium]